MKGFIGLSVLVAALGFVGNSQASTVSFFSGDALVDIRLDEQEKDGAKKTLKVDIDYDTRDWASIETATLSGLLSDDADSILTRPVEIVVVSEIEGVALGSSLGEQEVDTRKWYGHIDVLSYLTLGVNDTFSFILEAIQGDFEFHLAKLEITYTPSSASVSAVPVPAALFLFAPALLGLFSLRRKVKL